MEKLTRGQIWVARTLIPMSIGVGALCFIAFRPYERTASASSVPHVVQEQSAILQPGTSEPVHLEMVTVISRKTVGQKKYVTGIARKSDTPCWQDTPGAVCTPHENVQGPVGTTLVCVCR